MATIRWYPSGSGPQNGWGGNVGWGWSFDATYHGETDCRLTFRPKLQLNFSSDFTDAEKSAFMTGVAAAVSAAFNKWKIVPNAPANCEDCKTGVDVNVRAKLVADWTWTDDYEVSIDKEGTRSNMTNWHTGDDRFTAAKSFIGVVHEMGHMLGLDDEYLDATYYPNRTAADLPADAAQSVMAGTSGAQQVLKRHMQTIAFNRANVDGHLPCATYNLVTR